MRHAAYAVNEDDAGARAVRMSEAKEHKLFCGAGRRGINIIYVKLRVVNGGEEIRKKSKKQRKNNEKGIDKG